MQSLQLLDALPPPIVVSLSSGVAEALLVVAVASGDIKNGSLPFSLVCKDGTDSQGVSGTISWSIANKGGTITSAADITILEPNKTDPASTLEILVDVLAGVNQGTVRINVTTSMTPATFEITLRDWEP